ncbi:MAG: hypothetical protein HY690_05120 [Chloroflexi bacterium]|nr:hypothetical protein [Chloroflexota bacterium]
MADWLADSVNRRVTYHRTARLAAQDILERGVDLSKSRLGAYGQGFYTVTDPSGLPGDVDLRVAVRLRHPLVGHADEVVRQVDDVLMQLYGRPVRLTMEAAQQVRKAFTEQGYARL